MFKKYSAGKATAIVLLAPERALSPPRVALIASNATLTLAMVIVIPMTLEVADVPNADELRNVVSR